VVTEGPDDDDAPVVPLRLQDDEESRVPEEPFVRPHEENIYKATPAPLDDDDSGLPWRDATEEKASVEKGAPPLNP
jgi:hypothetical protein